MEILTTLSQEELGKLNQNLEGWVFLAPDLIKGHITRSLEIEDNPFKIIKCECGHILICKLELLNQALQSQEQICSCSKYTYHITNNICKQDIFENQVENLLELERKEFNSSRFKETALGIIPPAYGNGNVIGFNLDILLWAINTNSGQWKKKNDFIDNLSIFIRNTIIECRNKYPQELDKLLEF